MKKLKLYFDASAVGNLDQATLPREMADMQTLWEFVKLREYDIVISSTLLDELNAIKDMDKKNAILDYLEQVDFEPVQPTKEIHDIAKLIIQHGILTQKSYNDCMHIAFALVTGCDCIVTYNFKHLVNLKTIKSVRRISFIQGYGDIDILTAETLIKERS